MDFIGDKTQKTPLDYAKENHMSEIVRFVHHFDAMAKLKQHTGVKVDKNVKTSTARQGNDFEKFLQSLGIDTEKKKKYSKKESN